MKVVGLYLVRNEVDVIETNLRHHLTTILDEAIVVDNGSTDGTFELVADLADELPLLLASETGHFYQSERLTRMARYATRQGADWVLPIDADEFWVAEETPFRSVLQDAPADARALFVDVVNFVQRRDVLVARPGVLATMTMRPQRTIGTAEEASRLMQTGEVSWLELPYAAKCVHRGSPDVFVPRGNHLTGVSDGIPTDALTCLHAPIRARSVLAYKMDQGRRSVEDQSLPDTSWHLKRLWQMARAGSVEDEWQASSYENGALTVNGTDHELVRDDRLKDAVDAVAPLVRTTLVNSTDPLGNMELPVAAYLLALDSVPGWFSVLDARILVELDRMQRAHAIEGDLFEIGTAYGKSAILLGYLARPPKECLTVCDVFEHRESIDPESMPMINHWYADVTEMRFLQEYERFHQQPPGVIVGPSGNLAAAERAGTCRIVHVDGGHSYDVVRKDIETARTLLGSGGLVAFGGISAPYAPGSALAVWELVLSDGFVPLCITESKLYGTWEGNALDWLAGIDDWVASRPDVGTDIHTLTGSPVRRVFALDRPRVDPERLVRIPDLEAMAEA